MLYFCLFGRKGGGGFVGGYNQLKYMSRASWPGKVYFGVLRFGHFFGFIPTPGSQICGNRFSLLGKKL